LSFSFKISVAGEVRAGFSYTVGSDITLWWWALFGY